MGKRGAQYLEVEAKQFGIDKTISVEAAYCIFCQKITPHIIRARRTEMYAMTCTMCNNGQLISGIDFMISKLLEVLDSPDDPKEEK